MKAVEELQPVEVKIENVQDYFISKIKLQFSSFINFVSIFKHGFLNKPMHIGTVGSRSVL